MTKGQAARFAKRLAVLIDSIKVVNDKTEHMIGSLKGAAYSRHMRAKQLVGELVCAKAGFENIGCVNENSNKKDYKPPKKSF